MDADRFYNYRKFIDTIGAFGAVRPGKYSTEPGWSGACRFQMFSTYNTSSGSATRKALRVS